jgi:hypothetical protein
MQQAGAFFLFKNISSSACTLYGYPGFEAMDPFGAVEATEVSRGGSYEINDPGPHTVVLPPRQVAYFGVGWGDFDMVNGTSQGCIDVARVASVPPNQYTALYTTATLNSICPEGGGTPKVEVTAVALKSAFTIASP